VVLAALFPAAYGQAPDKFERETDVKASAVPEPARRWLADAFESLRSPRWSREIYESGYSYEAKFRWRSQYYSVEFGPDGAIQDVEVETEFTDLPASVQRNVLDYLSSAYRRHDIRRVQVQYSGEPDDLEDFFDENERDDLIVRYEIEYTAKIDSGPGHYREGLFDEAGRHLQSRRVILPPVDNLIF
jgi:hypothetical protein